MKSTFQLFHVHFLEKLNTALINRTLYTTHISKYIIKEIIKCQANLLHHNLKTEEIGLQMIFKTTRDNVYFMHV